MLNLTHNYRVDLMEFKGVGDLTFQRPCLGLMAVPRLLPPNFKQHLEFGHVANVDHLRIAN
jgi:hypothetical protein